jgi:hypothetical protein
MEFLELLDLPNTTELIPKKVNYRKENKRMDIKQYIRVKVEDSNQDYFTRVLRRVKQAVSTIITAEEKKEYYFNNYRMALQLDKFVSLVEEHRSADNVYLRENAIKRKYIFLNLDITRPSLMILILQILTLLHL